MDLDNQLRPDREGARTAPSITGLTDDNTQAGKPEAPRWTSGSLKVLLAGGLLAGSLAGVALTSAGNSRGSELDQIAVADVDAAALTLSATQRGTQADEAKACRVPLAMVTLVSRTGATDYVRIRSGSYTTPAIRLGAVPLRVALPYPAPYPTGAGDLEVQGNNATFDMYLNPGWFGGTAGGSTTVHVWWRVKTSC